MALALVPLLAVGCYRSTNHVTVPAVDTKHPVSVSGHYMDAQGNIVTEESYEVVEEFAFDKEVEAARHEEHDSTLDLGAELDEAADARGGDALTNVTISAVEYDPGSHGSAAGWKILGWTLGLTGATFAVTGLALDDGDTGIGDSFALIGAVVMGLGVLSYAASAATDDPTVWHIHVQGNVVKRTGAAPVSPATPAPAGTAAPGSSQSTDGAAPQTRLLPPPKDGVVPLPGYRPMPLSVLAVPQEVNPAQHQGQEQRLGDALPE